MMMMFPRRKHDNRLSLSKPSMYSTDSPSLHFYHHCHHGNTEDANTLPFSTSNGWVLWISILRAVPKRFFEKLRGYKQHRKQSCKGVLNRASSQCLRLEGKQFTEFRLGLWEADRVRRIGPRRAVGMKHKKNGIMKQVAERVRLRHEVRVGNGERSVLRDTTDMLKGLLKNIKKTRGGGGGGGERERF